MSFDTSNALQGKKPAGLADGKKSLFSSENSPGNPYSDDKDFGDDSTIVIDYTLVPEMPDTPSGEIGPPPPRRGRPHGRSTSVSRSSGAIAQPATPTQNAVLTSRITRSQAKSALVSILIRDPDKPIAFKETQDYLNSKK
jgi:hypothetical protein